jgi:undecaprenyl-diphosphatase
MLELLKQLDLSVFSFINHLPHQKILIDVALFFTNLGTWGAIWLIIGLAIAIWGKKKGFRTFWLMVAALITDVALNEYLIKLAVTRPRPYQNLDLTGLDFWDTKWLDSSFLSGHSFTAFACAYIVAKRYKKHAWIFWTLAVLISLSRTYLGAHWPSDVVLGSLLGLFVGWLIVFIENKYFVKDR